VCVYHVGAFVSAVVGFCEYRERKDEKNNTSFSAQKVHCTKHTHTHTHTHTRSRSYIGLSVVHEQERLSQEELERCSGCCIQWRVRQRSGTLSGMSSPHVSILSLFSYTSQSLMVTLVPFDTFFSLIMFHLVDCTEVLEDQSPGVSPVGCGLFQAGRLREEHTCLPTHSGH
jgi:hypothetical protein